MIPGAGRDIPLSGGKEIYPEMLSHGVEFCARPSNQITHNIGRYIKAQRWGGTLKDQPTCHASRARLLAYFPADKGDPGPIGGHHGIFRDV